MFRDEDDRIIMECSRKDFEKYQQEDRHSRYLQEHEKSCSIFPASHVGDRDGTEEGYQDTDLFVDVIDATTNGQLHGNYGHSRNYWTRPGNLQAEAFAHFFEASMGDQGKLELLANFFPTAFGIFSSMIDSIRPDNHVRVLSRER